MVVEEEECTKEALDGQGEEEETPVFMIAGRRARTARINAH